MSQQDEFLLEFFLFFIFPSILFCGVPYVRVYTSTFYILLCHMSCVICKNFVICKRDPGRIYRSTHNGAGESWPWLPIIPHQMHVTPLLTPMPIIQGPSSQFQKLFLVILQASPPLTLKLCLVLPSPGTTLAKTPAHQGGYEVFPVETESRG
jgi:hypothetical protein